jgi:hypothetical protein
MTNVTVSKFPVLTVKDKTVEWVTSEEKLRTATAQALKNGWFNDLLIVDRAGMGYRVERAEFVRKTGKRLFKSLFAPKLIEVQLVFKEGSPFRVSLDDLKRYLTKALNSDPTFWESGGWDLKQIKQQIKQASSVTEVLQVVEPMLTAGPGIPPE